MLKPITKQSLSDQVFTQLRDMIVDGQMSPGAELPSERHLSERLQVSRSAVREALKRLSQARLISIQQGEATRVLDFRQTAGLDLLTALVMGPNGQLRTGVVRSVMEMRTAVAPDIARLAAKRGGTVVADHLDVIVAQMRDANGDHAKQQKLAVDFWSQLVDGSKNVAYRLVYNTLIESYRHYDDLLVHVLADEHGRTSLYARIADAVRSGDTEEARTTAAVLSRLGQDGIETLIHAIEEEL